MYKQKSTVHIYISLAHRHVTSFKYFKFISSHVRQLKTCVKYFKLNQQIVLFASAFDKVTDMRSKIVPRTAGDQYGCWRYGVVVEVPLLHILSPMMLS